MNEEPQLDQICDDDDKPATNGFVRQKIKRLEQQIVEEADKTSRHFANLMREIEKTRRHFDVVAENIHRDVVAANEDELLLIKDQHLLDHEARIQQLEQHAGLSVGPKHSPLS